jgi:hypothetical protein
MAGINRANRALSESTVKLHSAIGIKCVFISHQQRDKLLCREIASYIQQSGLDVYFDEDDRDLKIYREKNDPAGVVNSIRKGINNSTHMLCVVSVNTIQSLWVPWEIGYAYDKIDLASLTLKGIEDAGLPHYLLTKPLIRGTKSLNHYISMVTGKTESSLILENRMFAHHKSVHPLDDVLDWNQ